MNEKCCVKTFRGRLGVRTARSLLSSSAKTGRRRFRFLEEVSWSSTGVEAPEPTELGRREFGSRSMYLSRKEAT